MNEAQRAVLVRSARIVGASVLGVYVAGMAIGFALTSPGTLSDGLAEMIAGVGGLSVFLFVAGAPLTVCALAVVAWFYARAGRADPPVPN